MSTAKKIKKVETPIDERETFVSLQKSFADNESNVQEKLGILYELQQVDNQIDSLVQLRGELPQEVAVIEGRIESGRSRTAHLEEVIDGYRETVVSCQNQIVELDSEYEKYRSQLENISNSREYDSINKELENTALLHQIAEKNIAEARQAIEDRKADISKVMDSLSVLEDDLVQKKEELDAIVKSTSGEEDALLVRKEELSAKLDKRTVSAYNRIRESVHNHLAVVTVYNNSCGGCFNAITPQRIIDVASGKKLVICEHCGRIIVAGESNVEEKQ